MFLLCELLLSPQRKPDDQQHNGVFPCGCGFKSLCVACFRGAEQQKKSQSKQEWDVFRRRYPVCPHSEELTRFFFWPQFKFTHLFS